MSDQGQLALNLKLYPIYSREDFFLSSSNKFAFQAIVENWPDWPTKGQFLIGPSGSGKTHLANIWAQYTKAIFLNPEKCLIDIQSKANETSSPITCIIDQALTNYNQNDLFHIYNIIQENNGHILICSTENPHEIKISLPDLRSRLFSLPLQTLNQPDKGVLYAVLIKRFSDYQIKVPENLLTFISKHLMHSFEDIHEFADRLYQMLSKDKKSLTLGLVKRCINEVKAKYIVQ